MTLLVISPDYASHLLPLVTLASAWHDRGEEVIVATGPATRPIVEANGLAWTELVLGRGSNPGVIRAEDQPPGEDVALRGFFDATRRGMVATLRYQADARGDDLLWAPRTVAAATLGVVDRVRPDSILVDHLAFGATLGLRAGGVPYADVVLGHPSALPVGDEVYGYPTAWPQAIRPDPEGLLALRLRSQVVRDRFTSRFNDVLAAVGPEADPVDDAFAAHGERVLSLYPSELHDPARTDLLPAAHTFLGSAVRDEAPDPAVDAWLARNPRRPLVYVSFGSFLSARGDVLARVAEAMRDLPVRVALAHGSTPIAALGPVPEDWLARGFLPQVTILGATHVAITHAGNNSVTEALTAGVPMLAMPFSTDQFAGAAALEAAGLGSALDPNEASVAEIRAAVERSLDAGPSERARTLAASLRADPGPERAYRAVADGRLDGVVSRAAGPRRRGALDPA
jgi:zeaxanthin glucosyltransferase